MLFLYYAMYRVWVCVLPVPHTHRTQKTAHIRPPCCTSPLQPLPFPPLLPHLWTSDQPGYQRASAGAVWPRHTHTRAHTSFIHPYYTQHPIQTPSLNTHSWRYGLPVWAVFPWKRSPTDQQQRRSRIEETSGALFPNTQPELFHILTAWGRKKNPQWEWKISFKALYNTYTWAYLCCRASSFSR